jgi:hypothetical protein
MGGTTSRFTALIGSWAEPSLSAHPELTNGESNRGRSLEGQLRVRIYSIHADSFSHLVQGSPKMSPRRRVRGLASSRSAVSRTTCCTLFLISMWSYGNCVESVSSAVLVLVLLGICDWRSVDAWTHPQASALSQPAQPGLYCWSYRFRRLWPYSCPPQ